MLRVMTHELRLQCSEHRTLVQTVILILFTLLLVHLILRIRSVTTFALTIYHSLSLFTPDLIRILPSIVLLPWTAFTDLTELSGYWRRFLFIDFCMFLGTGARLS